MKSFYNHNSDYGNFNKFDWTLSISYNIYKVAMSKELNFDNADRNELALLHLDKIFPHLPSYESFQLSTIIALFFEGVEYKNLIYFAPFIENLLVDEFHYARKIIGNLTLTDEGRKAQQAGGHKIYQDLLNKQQAEQSKQTLNMLDWAIIVNDRKEKLRSEGYLLKNEQSAPKAFHKKVFIFLGGFFQHTNNVVGTIGGIITILVAFGIVLSKCN